MKTITANVIDFYHIVIFYEKSLNDSRVFTEGRFYGTLKEYEKLSPRVYDRSGTTFRRQSIKGGKQYDST